MVRIAISVEAFEAIARTLPLGSVGYEAKANERGQRTVWLEAGGQRAIGTRSDRSLGPSSIPSLGDGVMLGTAWIDRPVDTQGCAPCFHVLLSAAWKRGHAQANDRHSSRVFAMPPRGFARTTRNG